MSKAHCDGRRLMHITAVIFALQTLFSAIISVSGGTQQLPLVVIGSCQLVPGLVVLVLVPAYRGRLAQLLRASPSWTNWLGYSLWSAAILGGCIVAAAAYGSLDASYDQTTIATYPLRAFVPAAVLQPIPFILFLLLVAPCLHLVNAAGEEFFWRGFLLDGLLEIRSRRTAMILSGLLWGAWHVPMVVFFAWVFPESPLVGSLVFTFALLPWGIVMAEARLRSDSLRTPILMHAVANALTVGLYDLLVSPASNVFTSPWGLTGLLLTTPLALRALRSQASK